MLIELFHHFIHVSLCTCQILHRFLTNVPSASITLSLRGKLPLWLVVCGISSICFIKSPFTLHNFKIICTNLYMILLSITMVTLLLSTKPIKFQYKSILHLLLMISMLPPTSATDNFIFVNQAMTWSDGETYCLNTYGTHLASIHNEAENIEAGNLCSSHPYQCWLGLNDIAIDSTWVWSDGSPYDYSAWPSGGGEPNGGTLENCVHNGHGAFTWNDLPCTSTRPILCNSISFVTFYILCFQILFVRKTPQQQVHQDLPNNLH